MKYLEKRHRENRPVGYGMIGRWTFYYRGREQSVEPQIIPFPTGRIMSPPYPGISCLATLIKSLRDKGASRLFAVSQFPSCGIA